MNIIDKIKNSLESATTQIKESKTSEELEQLRVKYLGRKGLVRDFISSIGSAPKELRGKIGQLSNQMKNDIRELIDKRKNEFHKKTSKIVDTFDPTLPPLSPQAGLPHPVYQTLKEICSVFHNLGFSIERGPEIELEFNNFEALNIPLDHPSRDAFDTFYINPPYLLRSHTSPVQIRVMKEKKPPLRIIAPGKVFRPDTPDASHSPMFHQVEGLLVDKKVSFADLKGVLLMFARELFGPEVKLKFRPSFFPFTEPSAEVDVSCIICGGKGCSTCAQTGWLEILGAGMVDPAVFNNVGYSPDEYCGFAFGLGVERVAMLKYGINDIRLFAENNVRFIRQFRK